MPKKILNINNFSGGLNEKTTPRDLAPNEFQRADNINNEIPGKLTLFGESVDGPYTGNLGPSNDYITLLQHGTGLHHINLDRDVDDESIGPNQYLFINDFSDSKVRIIDITSTGSLATKTIEYGNSACNINMYTIDGSTRIIPKSTLGTNQSKIFEYYNYERKLGTTSTDAITNTQELYDTSNMDLAPLKGDTLNYDVEDLHFANFFDPTNKSEVFLFDNYSVNSVQQINNVDLFDTSASNSLYGELDSYPNHGTDKGSMAFMAHFTDSTSDDTGGSILVSHTFRYGLFCSLVYRSQDGLISQESYPVFIGVAKQTITAINSADRNQKLYIHAVGRMGERVNRVAGFKVYWARISNYVDIGGTSNRTGNVGAKYLLCEVDYEKGLRLGGEQDYASFRVKDITANNNQFIFPEDAWNGSSLSTSNYVTLKPLALSSLPVTEPYTGSKKPSGIGRAGTTFQTSVMLNRRVYAGNVTYYDEHNHLVTKNDRVLKSLPNKFDYFPTNSFLDVAVEDGDEIIHLATINSKLLQFKKNKLFVINCQRDLEFLEVELDYKGCEYSYHVTTGPGFVAWFNRQGVYMYDGQRLLDLDLSKFGQSRFTSIYDKLGGSIVDAGFSESIIGYLPESKELVISNPSGQILKYDIKSESWSEGKNFDSNAGSSNETTRASDADITNFVNINNGDLVYAIERNDQSPNDGSRLRKWNNEPAAFTANEQVLFKSKEYDMDSPSVNKSIVNIYITYKRGENVLIKGFGVRVDGAEISDNLVANQTQELTNTSSGFRTQKIKVSNSLFKNVTSFGIELYADTSGTIHKDFTVNDIQIVFREKVAR